MRASGPLAGTSCESEPGPDGVAGFLHGGTQKMEAGHFTFTVSSVSPTRPMCSTVARITTPAGCGEPWVDGTWPPPEVPSPPCSPSLPTVRWPFAIGCPEPDSDPNESSNCDMLALLGLAQAWVSWYSLRRKLSHPVTFAK